jgi:carbon monoxide dehydrogenase subunit G
VELNHDFSVSVPIDEAWGVLTDLERIAPCMPGAQLQEVEGDEYRGVVKVKVGPITAQYKGAARIVELDPVAHRAVLRAEGRDTRGQGTAAATVTATLAASGPATEVHITTDLDITGKVAQFGRGVLGEVSEKLLGQFVSELEHSVLAAANGSGGEESSTEPVPSDTAPADPTLRRVIDSPERPPVDLLEAAGGSVLRRVGPALVVVALFLLLRRRRRRRRS